jgi:methionyl-tRNA formyltransferase
MYRIVLVGPAAGTKPFVVLSALLDKKGLIHWDQSLIITELVTRETPFLELVKKHNLDHIHVTDLSLESDLDKIAKIRPEFIISCGWGAKICTAALDLPTIAALNCHSSFLPDYKGADIYVHYWANCEDWMGASIHYMTEKFDEGRILAQKRGELYPNDTPESILKRISELTAGLLPDALDLAATAYEGIQQSGGRYFYRIRGKKVRLYRWYNYMAKITGLPKKLTPHKKI